MLSRQEVTMKKLAYLALAIFAPALLSQPTLAQGRKKTSPPAQGEAADKDKGVTGSSPRLRGTLTRSDVRPP